MDKPLPPAPAPGAVLEASVYAGDLDAAEAFYGGVLGLERILRAGDRHVFYRLGASVLLIFNPARSAVPPPPGAPPVPPHGATGPGHVCLAAPPETLEALHRRLLAAGIAIEAEVTWPNGARSLYLRDPAGNSVELAEPRLWARD